MKRRDVAGLVLGVLCAFASARPSLVGAQEAIPGGAGNLVAPDVSPDHWVMAAVRRAESLGLLERPLPFRKAVSADLIAAVLEEARKAARGMGPGLEELTEGWRTRFYEEFGGTAAMGEVEDIRLLSARLRSAVAAGADLVAPGFGEVEEVRTGAVPLENEAAVAVAGELSAAIGRHAGVVVEPAVTTDGVRLLRADLVVGGGNWRVAVGRQALGLGKSSASGLVLSGAVPLDRIEIRNRQPEELRGPLAVLGPVGLQVFLSRIWNDDRDPREPYFWGGSLSVQPLPRLGLAVHRAAMFGGRGYGAPATLKTFADMLIGRVANLGFENQIVSVEARYRLPTEEWAPMTVFLEWGAEDAAGGWWDVPGRVMGLESPALPGLEALSMGASFTSLAEQCCGNSPWYRHGAFFGNWAVDDRPLGHPLGGQGAEWLVYGTFDRMGRGYAVDGQLFRRDRQGQNLYHPDREESHGAALHARWRRRSSVEIDVDLSVESGSGWTERWLGAGANLYF